MIITTDRVTRMDQLAMERVRTAGYAPNVTNVASYMTALYDANDQTGIVNYPGGVLPAGITLVLPEFSTPIGKLRRLG